MKKMEEPGRMENETVFVPQEMLIEILLRVPVKSLVRFKRVCKSWQSLISDPCFATSHFEFSRARTNRVLFFKPSDSNIRSMDLDASFDDHDDSVSASLKLGFLHPKHDFPVRIMGSCRGFVLLDCHQNLYIWNPSTGVHKKISVSNSLNEKFLYGFGYDSSKDDYLIVLASSSHSNKVKWKIFSLRDNIWKKIKGNHLPSIDVFGYPRSRAIARVGSLFNSAIHWLAFSNGLSKNVIVAFDLVERTFSEMLLPEDTYAYFDYDDDMLPDWSLGVHDGFLSLFISVKDVGFVWIWVMKEYEVSSSWEVESFLKISAFNPICCTESGDFVGRNGGGLVKCDHKGKPLSHCSYSVDPYGFKAAMYTESLFSLP
ncbi:F-box/kelch-repeat protein At3g23880-like [Gastrolobium bilobum]|uniref:F-box/kelch-repeat protein At3g23880-like n=1 Tax=Gastrolobium bilobum TaxID=150636 RepID=UPI002AB00A86|nr:F-box/kelch-repeat protein At3g23880-like [Gastrolobium bilobum]